MYGETYGVHGQHGSFVLVSPPHSLFMQYLQAVVVVSKPELCEIDGLRSCSSIIILLTWLIWLD